MDDLLKDVLNNLQEPLTKKRHASEPTDKDNKKPKENTEDNKPENTDNAKPWNWKPDNAKGDETATDMAKPNFDKPRPYQSNYQSN